MNPIPSAETDAWNLATGSHRGRPSMIRFRPALREFCGDPRYPNRLTITWTFDIQQENGLPTDDQSDELKDFEDSIQSALDPDRVGILAFIFTSEGLREWSYYCGDMREVGSRINAALSDSPDLPITLESHSDADWSEMKKLLSQCKEQKGSRTRRYRQPR